MLPDWEAVESHCSTSHSWGKKKIWRNDSISSFPPNLAVLWALNMCLQRELSKQGYHFEHRLCATLTDLYGSSPRSLEQGCVVRLRRSLSSLWCGLLSLLLLLIPAKKEAFLLWISRCAWGFLEYLRCWDNFSQIKCQTLELKIFLDSTFQKQGYRVLTFTKPLLVHGANVVT